MQNVCVNIRRDSSGSHKMIRNYLNIFFYEACNIMLREPQNPADTKSRHKDEISSQFIKHLEHNIRKSRKVEFYARLMNITPKYLSAIIKETTGRPASDEHTTEPFFLKAHPSPSRGTPRV